MAKTYERLLSKKILWEKGRDSFDPQRVNLLGEDSICMANLLVIPQKIAVFFIKRLTCLGCFSRGVLFRQACVKIKMSPQSEQLRSIHVKL